MASEGVDCDTGRGYCLNVKCGLRGCGGHEGAGFRNSYIVVSNEAIWTVARFERCGSSRVYSDVKVVIPIEHSRLLVKVSHLLIR